MRKWVDYCCLVLLTLTVSAHADWHALGKFTSLEELPNGGVVHAGTSSIKLLVLSPSVVRVRYAPDGKPSPDDIFAVLQNAFPDPVSVKIDELADSIRLQTDALEIRILKSDLRVLFLDRTGQVILQDQPAFPVVFNGTAFRVTKTMPLDEHYFGLGDKAGPIDHRDQAFTSWNTDAFGWMQGTDPLYKSIPFFMGVRSGKAYGIFLDNTYRTSFDFGKSARDAFSFGSDGGGLDYYFIYGPQPSAVLGAFTALVGHTPLPPKFVLGFQQSRYSYFPESRVRELAHQFRDRKIPCDAIYLDIDYEDGYRSFTINRDRFPTFENMVGDLAQQGFKIVPIIDLHLKQQPGYRPYDEGIQHDYFVKNPDKSVYVGKVWPGDSVFPDFTRADVRKWFGTLYADFMHMGIRGFWNDMNEPAVFRYPEKTMPLETVHSIEGRLTDHREAHNIYGMQNVRSTYEGMLATEPNLRPYILTRAAFAGAQRYAATWTGDNAATWVHYRLSVTDLLSLGLSGYPLAGVDEGGFEGDPTPELLTRWTELGAFLPLFRNHSAKGTRDREPWVDGPEHEAIRKHFIEERYRLLPYIYTSMEETSRTGIPLMRPMFLEFPDQLDFATEDKEFMFGPDLLVAPKPDERVGPYEVKLPGTSWYDRSTGQRVSGTLKLDPPLETVPVFVRAGTILPTQPVIQSTDERPQGALELSVYPGPDCRGTLYDDDGKTFNYQKGEFLRMHFTCTADSTSTEVRILREGRYQPWWNAVTTTIFGLQHAPREVLVNGTAVSGWKFDSNAGSVSVTTAASASATTVAVLH